MIEVTSTFSERPPYRYIRNTDKLPTYDQLDEADGHTFDNIVCKIRLFNPTGVGTWWIAAYDPDTQIAWGVAELDYREVGSIGITELVRFRGRYGLPIERDLHFRPTTISAILGQVDSE
jgi:hypothetical protein